MEDRPVNDPFIKFDYREFWRLFIDVHRQKGGENEFDIREPGYKQAMYKAFYKMLSTLGQPLTADFLIDIHDTAIDEVKNKAGEDFQKGVSNGKASYPLAIKKKNSDNYNYTEQGLTELIDLIRSGKRKILIRSLFGGEVLSYELLRNSNKSSQQLAKEFIFIGELSVVNVAANKADNIKTLEHNIAEYYQNIKAAQTSSEKLFAIVKYVKDLEQSHVFSDGNQRTSVFLVLNKLLIENGFSPSIIEVPSCFDGLETLELVSMVEDGFKTFEKYLTKKDDNQLTVLEYLQTQFKAKNPEVRPESYELSTESYDYIAHQYDEIAVRSYFENTKSHDIEKALTTPNKKNQTLLHAAAAAGNERLFLRLMGFSSNTFKLNEILLAKDSDGQNVLHLLIENGNAAMVRMALASMTGEEKRQAILQKTSFGTSALFKAAHNSDPEILRTLLSVFADPIEKYQVLSELNNGISILHHIAMSGSLQSLNQVIAILGNAKGTELANLPVPQQQCLDDPPYNQQLVKGETAFRIAGSNKITPPYFFNMAFQQKENNHTLRDKYVDKIIVDLDIVEDMSALRDKFNEVKDSYIGKALRGEHGFHSIFSDAGNTKHWQKIIEAFQTKATALYNQNLSDKDQDAYRFIISIPKTRVDVATQTLSKLFGITKK